MRLELPFEPEQGNTIVTPNIFSNRGVFVASLNTAPTYTKKNGKIATLPASRLKTTFYLPSITNPSTNNRGQVNLALYALSSIELRYISTELKSDVGQAS